MNSSFKIGFRIDVGSDIGTGHYMRMSALAEALEYFGCTSTFYTREDEPVSYDGFEIVILDTYEINDMYIKNLRKPSRLLVCCDDNALYSYNCDVLLNANFHAAEMKFSFYGNQPKLLLGTQYAMLRREFRDAKPVMIRKKAKRIFVCFGGSDMRNFTPRAIQALQHIDDVELLVVLGAYTRHDSDVYLFKNSNIEILKNPPLISQVMQNCDIAVTAAGSMVYELASVGIPTVLITQARNQYKIAEYLEQNKLMEWVGNWDSVSSESLRNQVEVLLKDVYRRENESRLLVSAVNRKGALKAAQSILEVANEHFAKN